MSMKPEYLEDSIELLKEMIRIPSLSREEKAVADLLEQRMIEWGYRPSRMGNNLWIRSEDWQEGKPVVLLNSHIDTVKPAKTWSYDPFGAVVEGDRLIGLGSNDAGASVVSLFCAFRNLTKKEQPYNLIFCASAEEEISGIQGISSILEEFGPLQLAVVGEPTGMQMAVAEKGLMVLDIEAKGRTGHAARNEGENAIYKAIQDIRILQELSFPMVSEQLGPVKITVTQIEAGTQHNVVPDSCRFVADVRTNECYSNEAVYQIIADKIGSEVKPRSFRLNSSGIPLDHPLVKRGISMGLTHYGSPTTSDQAVIPYTSVKMGPGDSARSHTADEYILMEEIKTGVALYIQLLDQLSME
ncbi:MAG: M20 family metallo-hydrolase [Marinilabiliales bacterium]|nr:M20 family metallo-hydrolase [Marinilabiliales bacterium]